MQIVSSKEFASHPNKYLDMALSQDICIQRGENMFQISYHPSDEEQPVLQPDDDLRRAITIDELRESAHEHIRQLFANK
jgi:hypothetical protein